MLYTVRPPGDTIPAPRVHFHYSDYIFLVYTYKTIHLTPFRLSLSLGNVDSSVALCISFNWGDPRWTYPRIGTASDPHCNEGNVEVTGEAAFVRTERSRTGVWFVNMVVAVQMAQSNQICASQWRIRQYAITDMAQKAAESRIDESYIMMSNQCRGYD